jgi:hypothetical protein
MILSYSAITASCIILIVLLLSADAISRDLAPGFFTLGIRSTYPFGVCRSLNSLTHRELSKVTSA